MHLFAELIFHISFPFPWRTAVLLRGFLFNYFSFIFLVLVLLDGCGI